jgi:geranylgeranyl pyrophosphate synthase
MIQLVVWTTVGFAAMQILMWLLRKIAGANEMARIRADLCSFVEGSRRIYALFPPEYIIAPIEGNFISAAVESSTAEGTKWMEMTESHVEQVRRGLRLRISEVSKTISSPVFRDALEYTQLKPGKMIRSRLVCLLGTELGIRSGASLMMLLSQAVELEHCASLLHDDVVDDSDVRRGIESHRKKFGDKLAVLTGDNLISILVEVLTEIANMQVTRAISQSIESLVVGELLQLISKKDSALNYTDRHVEILFPASIIGLVISDPQLFDLLFLYMRKSFFKTASLFATLCQCTGILALGRDSSGLASFGFFFGIAFQIIDDLLDVSDDSDILVGKPVGGVDIRNGTVTLPVLFACSEKAKLAESERKELREMIHRRFSLGGDPERTLQLVLKSDAIALCRKLVNHYLNRCRADLRAACKKETFPAIEQLLVEYEFRTH